MSEEKKTCELKDDILSVVAGGAEEECCRGFRVGDFCHHRSQGKYGKHYRECFQIIEFLNDGRDARIRVHYTTTDAVRITSVSAHTGYRTEEPEGVKGIYHINDLVKIERPYWATSY